MRPARGFTLIELMIALVISLLLVGMILAIFTRLSIAYRGQQQVAGVQQVLASARTAIELDAKHAGLGMPTGIKIASSDVIRYAPVAITNSSTGPDQVRFMYADAVIQAAVTANGNAAVAVPVDDNSQFTVGDIILLTTPDTSTPNPSDPLGANVTTYSSCVLRVNRVPNGVSVIFDNSPPYGEPANRHCPGLVRGKSMMFKLVAHAYRIDPLRPAEGVLQMSPTGDLFGANDWQDLAYGFTDLQVATQFFDDDLVDTPDPDTDPKRDWFSSTAQQTMTQPVDDTVTYAAPLQMAITLVARTDRDVEGIASAATPNLTVGGNPNNNLIGDHPAVVFPSVDPALQGNRIYRYLTFQVDLRNTGIGR